MFVRRPSRRASIETHKCTYIWDKLNLIRSPLLHIFSLPPESLSLHYFGALYLNSCFTREFKAPFVNVKSGAKKRKL